MGISQFGRDFQGAGGTVFSTVSGRLARTPQMRSPAHRHFSVEVFANGDRAACQRVSKASLVQLQAAVLQNNSIILAHDSFRLNGKYQIQILAPALPESRSFRFCRLGKPAIELRNVLLPLKGDWLLPAC